MEFQSVGKPEPKVYKVLRVTQDVWHQPRRTPKGLFKMMPMWDYMEIHVGFRVLWSKGWHVSNLSKPTDFWACTGILIE